MSTWKLYWVEVAFDPTENCFVVAKNARSARSVEYAQWGESYDQISAESVLEIPEHIEKKIIGHYKSVLRNRLNNPDEDDDVEDLKKEIAELNCLEYLWPDYVDHRPIYGHHWLLNELGAKRYYLERRFITEIDGVQYVTGSFEDYLGTSSPSMILEPKLTSLKARELPLKV
jgi:hypothetical protein